MVKVVSQSVVSWKERKWERSKKKESLRTERSKATTLKKSLPRAIGRCQLCPTDKTPLSAAASAKVLEKASTKKKDES